ncbi:MAG: hypothetical protein Q7T03_04360 [Deltaproteobacteria bacterium]|nr:hypothetical protein [Deltaproteobacteria bacterium]
MRTWLLFFIYAVVILAIKSVWVIPGNFLLLAVIFFALHEEWVKGLALSLMLGFLVDCLSIAMMGTTLFSFAAVFGLVRFLRTKILFQTLLSRFFWVMIFSAVNAIVALIYAGVLGEGGHHLRLFLPRLLVGGLLDASLGLFWFPVLDWYQGLTWDKLTTRPDILLKK